MLSRSHSTSSRQAPLSSASMATASAAASAVLMSAVPASQSLAPSALREPASMQHAVRVTLAGDTHVGKTTLYERALRPHLPSGFMEHARTTVTTRIDTKDVLLDVPPFGRVTCSWTDAPGADMYRYIVPQVLRNADVVLLIGDMTSMSSIDGISSWCEHIGSYVQSAVPILLVWNKCDRFKVLTESDPSESNALQAMLDACTHRVQSQYSIRYAGCMSALTNENVAPVIQDVVSAACRYIVSQDPLDARGYPFATPGDSADENAAPYQLSTAMRSKRGRRGFQLDEADPSASGGACSSCCS